MSIKTQTLNLELSETFFIKNEDNTYTVYKQLENDSYIRFPRVVASVTAIALADKDSDSVFEIINAKKANKIRVLLTKFKGMFAKKEKIDE